MLGLHPLAYQHIYIWLVALLSIFVFNQYSHYPQSRISIGERQNVMGTLLLALFMILFIGLRPISGWFVDMYSYNMMFERMKGETFFFDWNVDNKIFDNYFAFLASNNFSAEFFFLSMAAIYFGCMAWACSSLFPKDKIAAFLVYLAAFSTFSYSTNGIKAGAAASLFLVALALFVKRRWLWTFLFLLFSLGFHHSMVLPITAFVICMFVKNPKWYFALWVVCLFMALFHITFFQQLFAGFTDEHGATYLLGNEEHIRRDILGGFRIDFILYSAVPILFGWIAIYRKKINISKNYTFILNLYTLANAVWLLCMYAEFTNRISYLSWLILPIVLIYPFLKENWGSGQYRTFQWVAFGHLAFTLFMIYIY